MVGALRPYSTSLAGYPNSASTTAAIKPPVIGQILLTEQLAYGSISPAAQNIILDRLTASIVPPIR
jgi:hypothetical protein